MEAKVGDSVHQISDCRETHSTVLNCPMTAAAWIESRHPLCPSRYSYLPFIRASVVVSHRPNWSPYPPAATIVHALSCMVTTLRASSPRIIYYRSSIARFCCQDWTHNPSTFHIGLAASLAAKPLPLSSNPSYAIEISSCTPHQLTISTLLACSHPRTVRPSGKKHHLTRAGLLALICLAGESQGEISSINYTPTQRLVQKIHHTLARHQRRHHQITTIFFPI